MDCRRGAILSPGQCIESDRNREVHYEKRSSKKHQPRPVRTLRPVRTREQFFLKNYSSHEWPSGGYFSASANYYWEPPRKKDIRELTPESTSIFGLFGSSIGERSRIREWTGDETGSSTFSSLTATMLWTRDNGRFSNCITIDFKG